MLEKTTSRLDELIDLNALTELLERFHKVTGLVIAIVDRNGDEIVSAGYRRICTEFHRACPGTSARCDENESYIREHIKTGKHITRKCKNGLTDAAYPITIDGEHVATVFSGQFLFEPPNKTFFTKQARKNGFEEKTYLNALSEVPVYSKEQIDAIMGYYAQFAEMLAQLGRQTKRLEHLNTELTSAHDALVRNESRLRLALRVSAMGTWERDLVTGRLQGDAAWKAMLGHTPDAMDTLESLFEFVHPDDLEALKRASQGRISIGSEVMRAEFRLHTAEGEWRWMQTTGQTIARDSDGNPTRVLGVIQDISARRHAEERFRQQREALAHVSRVSTMGELTASIAHEINQPLTAILANAQAGSRFLNRPEPDLEEVADVLVDIADDARRAGEVIRRLRALLRKGEIQHEPVNINTLITETCQMLNSEIVMRRTDLAFELTPRLGTIMADPVQIQQVLVNLILNGCEAMADVNHNTRLLTISTRSENGDAILSVTDTGTGIAPDQLENLFELFFTTKATGMGTGLAISSSIVDAHGGTIKALNRSEGGAEFRITLPTVRA